MNDAELGIDAERFVKFPLLALTIDLANRVEKPDAELLLQTLVSGHGHSVLVEQLEDACLVKTLICYFNV